LNNSHGVVRDDEFVEIEVRKTMRFSAALTAPDEAGV
jgi:hypothetical protein